MLVYNRLQLLSLARIYSGHTGTSISALGKLVVGGNNWRFFIRLGEGHGCSAKLTETATLWFLENWPGEIDWPKHIPDLRPELIDA